MEELTILSHSARINGLMYVAAGSGPHPIVIFPHGYPGNERNLDLAQAVRRAGYNAIFVDYRGVFGSGGTFSQAHSLEDVAALLAWIRVPETVAKYHINPTRIALVGHSFGAWLALFRLVAATHDTSDENPERHAELSEAIRKEGGKLVRVVTFEDDHPFSSHRIALVDTLTRWLRTDCARTQVPSWNSK